MGNRKLTGQAKVEPNDDDERKYSDDIFYACQPWKKCFPVVPTEPIIMKATTLEVIKR